MQTVGIDPGHWQGRRVFVTGHTGFLGGWLCLWLARLGAEVTGYALEPPTEPSFFAVTGLDRYVTSIIGDVRDGRALHRAVAGCAPQTAIHLAAQPLVRAAFAQPLETFETNVMGAVHLLEALRGRSGLEDAVIVTTDKVYDNVEWDWGYRECDPLGAHEPYGASKACAELVVESYRRSFFDGVGVATVRAGNIVGGGDWALDRLVPDAIRAFTRGEALEVRNPRAVRPWQHALEPGRGVLELSQRLARDPADWSGPWNFGPAEGDSRSVTDMADSLTALWGNDASWTDASDNGGGPYEARLLSLNSMKALARLGWRPRWSFERTLSATVDWYKAHAAGSAMAEFSLDQIAAYEGAN